MITLQDIMNELAGIREAANQIEVTGKQNAALLCYIYDRSNELYNKLEETIKQFVQNESENQEQPEITLTEVGEENGEHDTESA